MGIDIWEVIEAAEDQAVRLHALLSGPGLGGHCIPIDPFYLTWKAREYDISTRFIELAGEINTAHAAVRRRQAGRRPWTNAPARACAAARDPRDRRRLQEERRRHARKPSLRSSSSCMEARGAAVDYP